MLKPRLVELGKIKIGTLGEKKTTAQGKEYRIPKKLDHFIITTMNRDKEGLLQRDDELMAQLMKDSNSQDGHLREIPIALLSDEENDILQCAWVYYNGKTCLARSDGHTLTKFADLATGRALKEPQELPWRPELAEQTNAKGVRIFKKHTVLNCVVAAGSARWGGVYKFRTTSVISADQLLGMPLRLVVRPMQVAPEGKVTTVHVVHLELRGPDLQAIQQKALELAQFQLANRQRLLTVQRDMRKLLVAPGEESPIEAADIQQEFQPDEPEDDAVTLPETTDSLTLVRDGDAIDAEFTVHDEQPEERVPLSPAKGEAMGAFEARCQRAIAAATSLEELDAIASDIDAEAARNKLGGRFGGVVEAIDERRGIMAEAAAV
jgi:hypothetical protein